MRPVTEYSVTKSLEKIQPKVYEKKRFTNIEPTIESVRSQLESEAMENITSPLFWTLKRKREQYVLANLQDRYDMIHERWSKEKKEFDENDESLSSNSITQIIMLFKLMKFQKVGIEKYLAIVEKIEESLMELE